MISKKIGLLNAKMLLIWYWNLRGCDQSPGFKDGDFGMGLVGFTQNTFRPKHEVLTYYQCVTYDSQTINYQINIHS